ncbi:MAG: hypothetical protein ACE5K4_05270 [Candidatus Hydrothermarchaeota archaeon]
MEKPITFGVFFTEAYVKREWDYKETKGKGGTRLKFEGYEEEDNELKFFFVLEYAHPPEALDKEETEYFFKAKLNGIATVSTGDKEVLDSVKTFYNLNKRLQPELVRELLNRSFERVQSLLSCVDVSVTREA